MSETFEYDVFLSYSSADRQTVHALAERLRDDGLDVWFDEWVIKPGAMIGPAIQRGLNASRVLVLCMSPAYFASAWATQEHQTLLFRDPTNAQRRLIPFLLTDTDLPSVLAQFAYVDGRDGKEESYARLARTCREQKTIAENEAREHSTNRLDIKNNHSRILEGHVGAIRAINITPDGKTVVSGGGDRTVRVWDVGSEECIALLNLNTGAIRSVAITTDARTIISGSVDGAVRVWDVASETCRTVLKGHTGTVRSVAVTADGRTAASGGFDRTVRLWDIASETCLDILTWHDSTIYSVAITEDGKTVASGSFDGTVHVWDITSGKRRALLEGHAGAIRGVGLTADGRTAISGSVDRTVRVWDVASGTCRAVLEGHTEAVHSVALTADGRTAVSGGEDRTVRVWDVRSGTCHAVLKGHIDVVQGVAVSVDGLTIASAGIDRAVRVWDLTAFRKTTEGLRYTNAKVVLVGESGVGKTGLALRMAENRWEATESTHGMNVWPLTLPGMAANGMEREVWLWDFAGQPDYRLIHQLYMDETALAVLVIDPQRDDPFTPLGHWEQALRATLKHAPPKLLVAARCDRGGYTISKDRVARYLRERGYAGSLDTSAKSEEGCVDLKALIAGHIPWGRLPFTSTTRQFKTLKDAILKIRDGGAILLRIAELRQRLELMLPEEPIDESLRTVVRLLDGQGLVKRLAFGDWVLLQPEQINAYASAIVRAAREHTDEIGSVSERAVLDGTLNLGNLPRLSETEEDVLLRAIVQTFLNRALCVREETEDGAQLVFPWFFKQERPTQPDHPRVVVTYGFKGPLDEIYTTLVVRLHYTQAFEKDQLWRDAADFKTLAGQCVGFVLTKQAEDHAKLTVYADPGVPVETQVTFIKYVHEHLKKKGKDLTRVRAYTCPNPNCREPIANPEAIQRRLATGKEDIICQFCDEKVPLRDLIEERFGSDEVLREVREMDREADVALDNESRELILVGHAFSTVGEAGHIFRPVPNSDWGIDGEIEFKENGKASGHRVYLQLKSGDSYLRTRKRDGKQVFRIPDPRHAAYWTQHAYPVMLVIRTSDEQIHWMDVTAYLKVQGPETTQIVFSGEPFTALNVDRLRQRLAAAG